MKTHLFPVAILAALASQAVLAASEGGATSSAVAKGEAARATRSTDTEVVYSNRNCDRIVPPRDEVPPTVAGETGDGKKTELRDTIHRDCVISRDQASGDYWQPPFGE